MSYNIDTLISDRISKMMSEKQSDRNKLCLVSRKDGASDLLKTFFPSDWIPKPCLLTPLWNQFKEDIRNFEVYSDDIWLVSFPKTGSTWCQEMIWLIANNTDFNKANEIDIYHRVPRLELNAWLEMSYFNSFELCKNMTRPRIIKSHLVTSLLPDDIWIKNPKIVYISRNVKDVVVSYYHHSKIFYNFTGTFDEFVEDFLGDRVIFAPYYDHILEYYALNSLPNILFLTYEEMKKDLRGVIMKTATFLKRNLSEEQISGLIHHLSFESMTANKSVNCDENIDKLMVHQGRAKDENDRFIRKGMSGGWKTELSLEWSDKIDRITIDKVKDPNLLPLFLSKS